MLEEFLVESEAKWYMSPFELQYCTYYHHVMRAREFATKQLNEWNDAMKEKEKHVLLLYMVTYRLIIFI